MTIYTKSSEIDIRSKLNELDRPVGSAGLDLLRSKTSSQQQKLLGIGQRNLCVNGGFDVWQRGTSITFNDNGYASHYCADHWIAYFGGTYSKTSGLLPNGEYVNVFHGVLGSTGSNRLNVNFPIENGNRLISGKTVTLSWWMRASKAVPYVNIQIQSLADTTFSNYLNLMPAAPTPEITTEWKKYVMTFNLDSDVGNASARPHAFVNFDGVDADWAQNDWFELAQVQFEIGSVATPFEKRTYAEELAESQRYFFRLSLPSYNRYIATAFCDLSTRAYGNIGLPVPMRTSPAVSNGSGFIISNNNGSATLSSFSAVGGTSWLSILANTNGTLNVGQIYQVYSTVDSYIDFAAEI